MRITCPNCAAQYEVDGSLFPDEGREVQCSSCDTVWMQAPEPKVPPIRLDAPAPKPSDRMPAAERDALRSAVAEEIAVRDSGRTTQTEYNVQPQSDGPSEDDILAALRQQIQAEGGDFEKQQGPALSQKRNLKKAAETMGIDVDAVDDKPRGTQVRKVVEEDEVPKKSEARSKLQRKLQDYESIAYAESRSQFRTGMWTAIAICVIGLGTYMGRDTIAETVPAAAPYLETYAGLVDQGRDRIEALYAQYGGELVGQLTGGDAPAQ